MSERSAQEVGVVDEGQERRCPSCRQLRPADAFYTNCGECKECKKRRSRQNRALQARKLAAFERFVDVLVTIADQTAESPAERRRTAVAEAVA